MAPKNYFNQLSSVLSTQKLVKIHNILLLIYGCVREYNLECFNHFVFNPRRDGGRPTSARIWPASARIWPTSARFWK